MQILCHAFVSHSGLLYLCCLNTYQGTGRDQKSPENVKEEREKETKRDKEIGRETERGRERVFGEQTAIVWRREKERE